MVVGVLAGGGECLLEPGGKHGGPHVGDAQSEQVIDLRRNRALQLGPLRHHARECADQSLA